MTTGLAAAVINAVPRSLLFAAAALVQVGLIAIMVLDRVRILRSGTEVTLRTRPVDPRDFLRGDYVTLSYEISTVNAPALKDSRPARKGMALYVKLAPRDDGYHAVVAVGREPMAVSGAEVLLQGHVSGGFNCGSDYRALCESIQLKYGIERYFVPEGEGRELENARNDGKLAVVAAVMPGGRAAIKRLLLDGKQVYDEPYF
jgi:uncharacterized membrane-anchored protein